MVRDPNPPKIDPVVGDALRKYRPRLTFDRLAGNFVTDPESNGPVTVWRANSPWGVKALIYKTRIIEDDDGDPEAYAAPISDTNPAPRGGHMNETSIFNATSEKTTKAHPKVIFHADNTQNTFHWTGVHSRAETAWDVAGENPGHANPGPHHGAEPGSTIDFRPFLKSVDGTFPIFRQGTDFYAPQTAVSDDHGNAINARVVPYGAASAKLRDLGGIGVGDVGLALRPAYGLASPFVFADTGGDWKVGEYSVALARKMFGGGHPNQEAVSFIVFPRTSAGSSVIPAQVPNLLRRALINLAQFENVWDIAERLAVPQFDEPLYIGRSFVPKVRFGRSFKDTLKDPHSLEYDDDVATANARAALKQAGLPEPPAPVDLNQIKRDALFPTRP